MRFEKGHNPWNKGKIGVYSAESLTCMSMSAKGKVVPPWTEERRHEMSKQMSGRGNPFFGKCHTNETRKRMREAGKGRVPWNKGRKGCFSMDVINKLSKAGRGRTSPNKGKQFTVEWRNRLSDSHKGQIPWIAGKFHSEETKQKMKITRASQIVPKQDTKIEVKVQEYLRRLQCDFIPHKYMRISHAYRCDIFIPSRNMVIECDGDYFHGPQFPDRQRNDKLRATELRISGYKVLRLWEHEINEMTLEEFRDRLDNT